MHRVHPGRGVMQIEGGLGVADQMYEHGHDRTISEQRNGVTGAAC
jgi:hypothetical protein